MSLVLILRPEPGATETALRARTLGLEAVKAPLFEVRPLPWEPAEPGEYDAVLLTSANAARAAAPLDLPCYAVGEATADAARAAGFTQVHAGPSDGAAALAMMGEAGVRRALHLAGREHLRLEHTGIEIERRIVYAAEPVERLPAEAEHALAVGALVLLHSAGAARLFASLVEERGSIRLAAISTAAAEAAGSGWAETAVADAPRDEALLELAAKLCNMAAAGAATAGA